MNEKIAYFDNAATTFLKPESVYVAMDNCARNFGVSMGRGQHLLSARASHIADETRELILQLFHCSNKKVVFTNTATEAFNIIPTHHSTTATDAPNCLRKQTKPCMPTVHIQAPRSQRIFPITARIKSAKRAQEIIR